MRCLVIGLSSLVACSPVAQTADHLLEELEDLRTKEPATEEADVPWAPGEWTSITGVGTMNVYVDERVQIDLNVGADRFDIDLYGRGHLTPIASGIAEVHLRGVLKAREVHEVDVWLECAVGTDVMVCIGEAEGHDVDLPIALDFERE